MTNSVHIQVPSKKMSYEYFTKVHTLNKNPGKELQKQVEEKKLSCGQGEKPDTAGESGSPDKPESGPSEKPDIQPTIRDDLDLEILVILNPE